MRRLFVVTDDDGSASSVAIPYRDVRARRLRRRYEYVNSAEPIAICCTTPLWRSDNVRATVTSASSSRNISALLLHKPGVCLRHPRAWCV